MESLSPAERIVRYRQTAAEIMRLGMLAPSEDLRAGYLQLVARWAALAQEVERQLERTNRLNDVGADAAPLEQVRAS